MTRRRAYFFAIVLSLIFFGAATFAYQNTDIKQILPAHTAVQPGFYRVLQVYDGDTVEVDMGGTAEKVRMIGVDTPETHKPNTPVQCFGPEASDFTTKLLGDKTVRLEADPTNSNRDRYERLLRYVYTEDGTLVSQALIDQGYGFAYLSFPFEKADAFAAAQETAKAQGRGVWAACAPVLKSGRWQSNFL